MGQRICSIGDCGDPVLARGWCNKHYKRWRNHGDPLVAKYPHYRTPEMAFAARTHWDGECLVWTGGTNGLGYGQIVVEGKHRSVHLYAWKRANGPIPDGLYVDHRCWNPLCVRLDHLRLASASQNSAYLSGPRSNSSSGFRGVYPRGKKYVGQVSKGGRTYNLGTFHTAIEAARVVDAKRRELYGEFAGLTQRDATTTKEHDHG